MVYLANTPGLQPGANGSNPLSSTNFINNSLKEGIFVKMDTAFEEFCKIDINKTEYLNLKNAVIKINWEQVDATYHKIFFYTKIVPIVNFAWDNDKPIFRTFYDQTARTAEENEIIRDIREAAVPFFNYLENLIPNHLVARAEIMFTPPEKMDIYNELRKMHIDCKFFHYYLKRCQLAFLTNSKSLLFVEGDSMQIPIDALLQFDNTRIHWGVNYGDSPKVCLMIEFVKHGELESLDSYTKDHFFKLAHKDQELPKIDNYKINFLKERNHMRASILHQNK